MPSFDIEKEQINVFDLGDNYLFKQYFDQDQLERYYNREKYRLEVPEEHLSNAAEVLEEFFFKPEIVHRPDEYCVATEETVQKDILRNTVHTQRHSN